MKTELYHATLSGKNNENIASLRRGIDSRRSQGFGQGAGFYLWRSKQRALEHARGMATGEFLKEVPLEGQPVIVTVSVEITPEDFDIDYEEVGPAFLRFLEPNKDWLAQHSAELMVNINSDGLGIRIGGDGMPQRSMRFDSTELSASRAQSLGRLAERISALEPEVMRRFELAALKQAEALKYVGSRPLYPTRIERLDGALVANPYKAVIPIVSGIAYVRNGGKTYADLMEELRWLGPGVVARTIQRNTMSNCSEFAGDVAQYLLERGFETAPTGTEGHYSVAVNTADRDWIETDPTAVQFSGIPWNESNALQMGGIDLSRSRAMSTEAKEAVLEKVFEPTIAWSVEGLLTGLSAFKISNWKVPARIRLFSPNTVRGQTMGRQQDPSWRAYWSYFRKMAEDLTKPDMGDWEFIRTWYWAPEVSRRMQGKRISGSVMKSNPADLAGRHIPEKYLAGLPPALQKQRIRELTESRDAYKTGDFSELPTDRAARKMGLVKESSYTSVAKKRGIEWRGNAGDMAARVLQYYGAKPTQRDVMAFAEALNMSFRKGLAAWKSGGHRPGATAQNWAVARVNSLVVGGKTAWTADKKQFAVLPADVRKKVVGKLPELYKSLTAQGRGRDVASIKGKAKANPVVKPELRQMIAAELALPLRRPLYSYAKKLMDKYGSRASGTELLEDAVQGAQNAIIGHFVDRYDDDFVDMYASGGDLFALRPIAIGVGQSAIRSIIQQALSLTTKPDLSFWRRVDAAKISLTDEDGKPPTDEQIAEYFGLTLDEYNRKKYERQVLSQTSYDRYIALGVEPGAKFKVEPLQIGEERPGPEGYTEVDDEGLPEPGSEEAELAALSTGEPDALERLMLEELGIPEGYGRLLADAIVTAALDRLDPNDRILVDTYMAGDSTAGMTDRQFKIAIEGGWDPGRHARVPGLVDRVRPLLLDTAERVMALPEEVRDQIATGAVQTMPAVVAWEAQQASRQKRITAQKQAQLTGGSAVGPSAPSAPATPSRKVPRLRAFRNR